MLRPLKLLVGLFGVVELLAPRLIVEAFTRFAYRNAEGLETREWAVYAARGEGLVLATLGLVTLYEDAGRRGTEGESGGAEGTADEIDG